MQALSNHHRSFAVDLWGFGDSSKTVGDYTLGSHVAMLSGFVDKMGIARPLTVVGHSLGAAVALNYAKFAPDSVDRIVAIALPLSGDHINGQLTGRSAAAILEHSMNKFDAYPEVIMGLEKADADALEASVSQIGRLSLADDLRDVECPVLLVFGARDSLVKQPTGELDELHQGRPDRHCVSIEDSSHFPMLEQPAVFNRLLKEFINHTERGSIAPKNYWQRRMR